MDFVPPYSVSSFRNDRIVICHSVEEKITSDFRIPEPPEKVESSEPYIYKRSGRVLEASIESKVHPAAEIFDAVSELSVPEGWEEWRQTSKGAKYFVYCFMPHGITPGIGGPMLYFEPQAASFEGFQSELFRDILRSEPHILGTDEVSILRDWLKPCSALNCSFGKVETIELNGNRVLQISGTKDSLRYYSIVFPLDFPAKKGIYSSNMTHLLSISFLASDDSFDRYIDDVKRTVTSVKWKEGYLKQRCSLVKPLEEFRQPVAFVSARIKRIDIPPEWKFKKYPYERNELWIAKAKDSNDAFVVLDIQQDRNMIPALQKSLQQPLHTLSINEIATTPLTGDKLNVRTALLDQKKIVKYDICGQFCKHGIIYCTRNSEKNSQISLFVAARTDDIKYKTLANAILKSIKFDSQK